MKTLFAASLLSLALIAGPALADDAAAPAPAATDAAVPKYSTVATTINDLLADEATKAVLEKHLPGISNHPNLDMARGMTLKAVQGFAPDMLPDTLLAAIDTDLAALPAK